MNIQQKNKCSIFLILIILETSILLAYLVQITNSGGYSTFEILALSLFALFSTVALVMLFPGVRAKFTKIEQYSDSIAATINILLLFSMIGIFVIGAFELKLHPVLLPSLIWLVLLLLQSLIFLQPNTKETAQKNRQYTKFVLILLVTLLIMQMTIALFSNELLINSEAYTLINTSINFSQGMGFININIPTNTHYSVFTPTKYERLMIIHPPLLDILNTITFDLFGIGVSQALLSSYLSITIGVLLAIWIAYRYLNLLTAILITLMALLFPYLSNFAQYGRGDSLVGLFYCVVVALVIHSHHHIRSEKKQWPISFCIGLSTTLALASHLNAAFIAIFLIVYLLFLIKQRKSLLPNILAGTAGVICILLPWNFLYAQHDTNFIEVMQHIITELVPSLNTTNAIWNESSSTIFTPLYKTWGGWLIITGNILFLLSFFIQWLKNKRFEYIDLILILANFCFFFFYSFVITKSHQQYLLNIFFVFLLTAARGFYWVFIEFLHLDQNKVAITATGLLIVMGNLCTWRPVSFDQLRSPNFVYLELRDSLSTLLPDDETIIVGSELSYIIYDKDIVNNWVIFAERDDHSFIPEEIADWLYNTSAITSTKMRSIYEEAGNVSIIPDTSGWFQSMSFDENIWKNYTKVAVISVDDHIFPIYYHDSILEKFILEEDKFNTFHCTSGGVNIIYGNVKKFNIPEIYEKEWLLAPQSSRFEWVKAYFEYHDWLQQPELEGYIYDMMVGMDSYMQDHLDRYDLLLETAKWDDGKRTVQQAIEASLPIILQERFCEK